ncbi:MAG TPA: PDZ domain-containing protein [Planctomycetota bacterium]|nr:PDZ domain-containing protein [Planctomycetota bacterium]
MKRLALILAILLAGCSKEPPSAARAAPAPTTPPAPVETARAAADRLLAEAEKERTPALYEQAVEKYDQAIAANEKDPAAHEGRALARWRLAIARGVSDPEVAKDLDRAGERPKAKALKTLALLVETARVNGGWEPLPGRILKAVIAKAFPESAAFTADWDAFWRWSPDEVRSFREALSGAPDWPLAAGVRAALEGHEVPPPGKEGILWIYTALRQPPAEALKTLEAAEKESPDQGILIQAQALIIAAEGRLDEASGRTVAVPMPALKAAASVAAKRPAPALESLGPEPKSPFGRALRAVALLQTDTEASIAEMDKLVDDIPLPWFRFERGMRRMATGHREATKDLHDARASAGAYSEAWFGLGLWHLQELGASEVLAKIDLEKVDADLAFMIREVLGYSSLASGEEDKGAKWLLEAAAKRPTRDTFLKYAPPFRANRQWKALQSLAEIAAREIPADPEPWAARAEACFWLKEYDAAVETVTLATGQGVDGRKLFRWRALALEEQGKSSEAHDDWDRMVGLEPMEGEGWAHRAWMKAKLGRWEGAKDDAEKALSRGIGGWSSAVARFALAAVALHGPKEEAEEADPAARKERALEHLRQAVNSKAVEPSDLKAEGPFAPLAGTEEWKQIVASAAEKQAEQKKEAKENGFLGVMLDDAAGKVEVKGTYRKSGARKAGLAPGDTILEVDGRRVSHNSDLHSILAGRKPGETVTVKIERELRPKLKLVQVRTVTLTERPTTDD